MFDFSLGPLQNKRIKVANRVPGELKSLNQFYFVFIVAGAAERIERCSIKSDAQFVISNTEPEEGSKCCADRTVSDLL